MKPSARLLGIGILLGSFMLAGACKDKAATPIAPAPPAPAAPAAPPVAAAITTPTLTTPIGGTRLSDTGVTLRVTNATLTGSTDDVKYRFEWSELDSFPENSRTGAKEDISPGTDTTSYTITDTLTPGFKYYWRSRAYTANLVGEWSNTESFVSANKGFIRGQEIYDPLTTGVTVGVRVGGQFIDNVGWQATTNNDSIDYDIPTCTACTVEFDVTGFGPGEGRHIRKDLKFLSMGDGSTFNNFSAFRNHVWKMHFEQRGDGNGSGMKLIWRNGRNGDGDPGDHEGKVDPSSVNWRQNGVFHITFVWTPGSYQVWVGETQPDGNVSGDRLWFQGSFARAYAPPNHRVQLGTRIRGDTIEATWRNVRVYPGGRRTLNGE